MHVVYSDLPNVITGYTPVISVSIPVSCPEVLYHPSHGGPLEDTGLRDRIKR